MTPSERAGLRDALRRRYPWLLATDVGPAAVEAGECDRCGAEARLVAVCGPGAVYLGRRCAIDLGEDAWCAGHAEDAIAALAWLERLPAESDTVARLWWVATGEVALDPDAFAVLRAALPATL